MIKKSAPCPICSHLDYQKKAYSNHKNKSSLKLFLYKLLSHLTPRIFIHIPILNKLKARIAFIPNAGYVNVCTQCQHGIYTKKLPEKLLDIYYLHIYHKINGRDSTLQNNSSILSKSKTQDDWRSNEQVAIVRPFINSSLSIKTCLEIGAGSAQFTRNLQETHPNISYKVIDPNPIWIKYYKTHGITLIDTFFPPKKAQKVDYIHTSHFIEHVQNIHETITHLKKQLNPNGALFIEVPLCNSHYWESDRSDGPHIQFFSEKSLKMIMEQNGFKTLSYDINTKHLFIRALFQLT